MGTVANLAHAGLSGCAPRTTYQWPAPVTRNLFSLSLKELAVPTAYDSYLVDSASSHMLVSKIKPCMSKYKQLYSETANGSLNQLSFI